MVLDYFRKKQRMIAPSEALLKRVSPRVKWDPAADEAPQSAERISRRVGFEILLPTFVPTGYRLLGSFAIPCECGRGDAGFRNLDDG